MTSNTIVVELGGSLLRIGFAGESVPRFISSSNMFPASTRSPAKIRQQYTELFHSFFLQHLQIRSKDYRVLIIEKFFTPRTLRNCLLTSLLKDLQVISVSMQPDLLLPLLATGMKSGIVVDIGDKECRVIAIAHDRALMHSYRRMSHAAKNFVKSVLTLLNRESKNSEQHSSELFEKVADCSEDAGCVNVSVEKSFSQEFILPADYRSRCFNSLITGMESYEGEENDDEIGGVSGLILECVRSLNVDVRAVTLHNICFCGGGSMIQGLPNAICKAAIFKANNEERYKDIKIIIQYASPCPSPFLKSSLIWIGGSIFSSLKSNDSKFIKLKDVTVLPRSPIEIIEIEKKIADDNIEKGKEILLTLPHVNSSVSPSLISHNDIFSCPDWLSLEKKNWIFFGPQTANNL